MTSAVTPLHPLPAILRHQSEQDATEVEVEVDSGSESHHDAAVAGENTPAHGNMQSSALIQEPTPPHLVKQDAEGGDEEREEDDTKDREEDHMDSNDRDNRQHGRRRSRSDSDGNNNDIGDQSSNSGEPAFKRRRNRKGLNKKFACPHIGCGKSYSRAEHLHRHQLNHAPKQIYVCDHPGCDRSFVRLDLCNRHRDRHLAKSSPLNRRDGIAHSSQVPPVQGSNGVAPLPPQPPPQPPSGPGSPGPSAHPAATFSPKAAAGTSGLPSLYPSTTSYGDSSNGFSPIHNEGLDYGQPMLPPPNELSAIADSNSIYASSGVAVTGDRPRPAYRSTLPPRSATHTGYSTTMSPSVAQHGFRTSANTSHAAVYAPTHSFPAFYLPPSNFVSKQRHQQHQQQPHAPKLRDQSATRSTPAESSVLVDTSHEDGYLAETAEEYDHDGPSVDMMGFDGVSMPSTMPIFGPDNILQKSPHVGLPDDLISYLFSTTPQETPLRSVAYPNKAPNPYSVAYHGYDMAQLGYFPTAPQQVMAVTNLVDQHVPEALLSEEKSAEIYALIKERFHEHGRVGAVERRPELVTEGDRGADTHMLSRAMMQAYIMSYWVHFSDQIPILHKPTFVPDRTPNLLLIAMMVIGAACLDKGHGDKVIKAGARLSNYLAWYLRWEQFMDANFRPPAKLWVFQTLLLLELYEKMYSTRELHERAHIHHATTITLMRRGRALIGRTGTASADSPLPGGGGGGPGCGGGRSSSTSRSDRDCSSRQSSTSGGPAATTDQWWNSWIANEATRRTAFAAFAIDSIHATMFGHSTVMVAHEMRLPLPCDDRLWKATSGTEVGRAEAQLASEGVRALSFLEGLKRTLARQEVRTNAFGRAILMAGLLSVSWHMHQRDLQINSLGGSDRLGSRDKWRITLIRAFDAWKADYDKALQEQRALGRSRSHGTHSNAAGLHGRDHRNSHSHGHSHGHGQGLGIGLSLGLGLDHSVGHDHSLHHSLADPYAIAGHADDSDVHVMFESRVVLHHLAHMATHVSIIDLQMFARAKWLLGRAVSAQDLRSAQRRMTDFWAPSARARDATYYAIQFLCSVLLRNEGNSPKTTPPGQTSSGSRPGSMTGPGTGPGTGSGSGSGFGTGSDADADAVYSARDDVLLNRPWVLYFAALVVWSYGHALEGPCPQAPAPDTWSEKVQHMREYLHQFGSIASPDELQTTKGFNGNSALLLVLQETFGNSRWELLHEGARLLGNCVQLNMGQMV